MVDIYRDVKHQGIYLVLGTDPEGDSCFSIYQNNGMKIHLIFKESNTMQTFFLFLARALSDLLKSTLVDFQQILKEKYFVLTKNSNFVALFVFAVMASSLKTKLTLSVTDGKRDAILTSVSKSTTIVLDIAS